jgi:hypothetical protein
MSSRKDFAEANVHLVPFRIIPTYEVKMQDPDIRVRRFFINITPQSVSSNLTLAFNKDDPTHPLSQYENLICIVKKAGYEKSFTVSTLLQWANEEIITRSFQIPSTCNLDSIWHTSFAISDPQLNAASAMTCFKKSFGRFPQLLNYKDNSSAIDDWLIVDNRRSIMSLYPKEVYSARCNEERWRKLVCHFNNWNDLLLTYFTVYLSLKAARSFINNGGKVTQTVRNRLLACYNVYEELSASGWRKEIKLLEKSFTGESLVRKLRDDITPKEGDVVNIINNKGIVNIADYMNQVSNSLTQNLEGSDESDEIKKTLKQLSDLIAAIGPSIDSNKAMQMGTDLKRLGEEMALPEPRRAWYEISLNGIKEAALAVGEIAKPIVDTVLTLGKLLVP